MATRLVTATTNDQVLLDTGFDLLVVAPQAVLWDVSTVAVVTANDTTIRNAGSILTLGAEAAIDIAPVDRATLVNRGWIAGGTGTGVTAAGATLLALTNFGAIEGSTAALRLVLDPPATGQAAIRNQGSLSGAIGIDAGASTAGIALLNTGTIEGRTAEAILLGGGGGQTNRIVNSGTIDGSSAGILAGAGIDSVELVVNTGRILGGIDLGLGADTYDGAEGRASGTIAGGAGDDLLLGGIGAETFAGGDGEDRIEGGEGNDWIDGGAGGDELDGGAGRDTVLYLSASASVTVDLQFQDGSTGDAALDLFTDIEAVIGSAFNDRLLGNETRNRLEGRDGNDVLEGRGGADTLLGGLGDDRLLIDDARDFVIERDGEGTDRVEASVSYALAANAAIEVLATADSLSGATPINLTGSEYGNTIYGNFANNALQGRGGDDTLVGGSGTDTLNGGDGNDIVGGGVGNDLINGGAGADRLSGDIGQDVFLFDAALGFPDTIVDFVVADDTIRLENAVFTGLARAGALAATMFQGSGVASDADDRILFNPATRQLWYDSDGSGAAAAELVASILSLRGTMTAADFVVI